MGKKEYPDRTKTLQSSGDTSRMIGPYRLLQKIGEGGMGEVWVAEQNKPIHRRVALKLIKAGMDSKQVIARFESERQALAMMDHPAIAKVFDAGETEAGHPYFVMEYVKGIPVTAYCDQNRLTTQERLVLFRNICEGVQHAHQKAIIHRDLKPSNILVAIQDGKAVPKIIDFGVAKATAQSLTERTMYTELGMLIGTPEYMSPEQAEMSGQNVDTRTDVYSLGAILYELLVGALPFDPKELRRAGLDEIRRKIREEDPPKPSTRLSTMGDASTIQAQNRRTERPALIRQIKGDLDWITMKALEKDRTRRYGSPSEFAADIDRYLHHQPIVARPPSTAYKAKKFVRRHRTGVAVATTLTILLIAFSVTTAVQARRIANERDRANQEAEASSQVSEFLVNLFKVSDPSEARGNSITAREILEKGAAKIESELAAQPIIQARIMETIGQVYQNLGLFSLAEPLLKETLEIRRKAVGENDSFTGTSMINLAWLYISLRRTAEAESLVRDGVRILETVGPEENSALARGLTMLGMIQRDRGEYDLALGNLVRALEISERVLGPDHDQVSYPLYHLGWLHKLKGEFDEAEKYYQRALAIMEEALGPDHPSVLWCVNDLAVVADNRGDYEKAKVFFNRAINEGARILGPEHPFLAAPLNNFGILHWKLGEYTEAESCYLRSLELREKIYGPDHSYVAGSLNNLGLLFQETGDYDRARQSYARALEINEKTSGRESLAVAENLQNLAIVELFTGEHESSKNLFERALRIKENILGAEHPDIANLLLDYALFLRVTKEYGTSESLYERALKIKEKAYGPGNIYVGICLINLAKVHAASGERDKADGFYKRALEVYEKAVSRDDYRTPLAQATYWAVAGDTEAALKYLKRALELGQKRSFFDSPDFVSLRGNKEFEALVAESKKRFELNRR